MVPKYQRDISGIEDQVLSLYARGMSTGHIHKQLQDLYGTEMSADMVGKITNRTLPTNKEWQSHPLNPVYYPYSWTASIIKSARMPYPELCS